MTMTMTVTYAPARRTASGSKLVNQAAGNDGRLRYVSPVDAVRAAVAAGIPLANAAARRYEPNGSGGVNWQGVVTVCTQILGGRQSGVKLGEKFLACSCTADEWLLPEMQAATVPTI